MQNLMSDWLFVTLFLCYGFLSFSFEKIYKKRRSPMFVEICPIFVFVSQIFFFQCSFYLFIYVLVYFLTMLVSRNNYSPKKSMKLRRYVFQNCIGRVKNNFNMSKSIFKYWVKCQNLGGSLASNTMCSNAVYF